MFSEGIDAALTAYEHRSKIREIGQWLWNRVTKGEVRIVVFGSAGAGKSTLGAVLAGKRLIQSTTTPAISRPTSSRGEFLAPSSCRQGKRIFARQPGMISFRHVGNGRSSIVLHVVSWGLNPIGDRRYSEVPGYEGGISAELFAESYFEEQRADEIATLEGFAGEIGLAPHRLSLVTVVVKQDLWWGERQRARAFYENGRYAAVVSDIRDRLGAQNFSHKIWSACLLRRNIVDNEGTLLRATVAGYDDVIKNRHEHKLMQLIRAEAEHG